MKMRSQHTLESLMSRKLHGLSETKAIKLIGTIIDVGSDQQSLAALDHANDLLDQFLKTAVSDHHACRAHYFRANIWSGKRHTSLDGSAWVWKSELIDEEILELRKALRHQGFSDLHLIEKAQIFTNLGNALNHIGRFVEAIEYWDRAISIVPKFAMASGNRGIGLGHYAGVLYDTGHQEVFMVAACMSLAQACEKNAVIDSPNQQEALSQFADHLNAIWSYYDIPKISDKIDLTNHPMGRSKKERRYREWCLNNRLFINPLNDIGPNPIAAHDVMTLPSITVEPDDGPGPPAIVLYFNVIKQEFCTARYALYEGINTTGVHFSDRKVLLYNTLDYPAFGFAVERVKMAFRGAYAVFDKAAFLLNAYFDLGHPERHVNFRNIWYKKGKGKALHPALDGMGNWPLRGLFWLSKDIFEDDFREITEPDAQSLYELRNHMEHKFVSVHDDFLYAGFPHAQDPLKAGVFDISVEDFAAKTLRQLKLARATITYLSLAVFAEEQRRSKDSDPNRLVIPMELDTWEDDWKRLD